MLRLPHCCPAVWILLGALLLAVSPANAEDELGEPGAQVAAAIEAHTKRDLKALKSMAESAEINPWAVAHELVLRDNVPAARTLAESTKRKDLRPLKRYVADLARRRPKPIATWVHYGKARGLAIAEKWFDVLELLDEETVGDRKPDYATVQLQRLRGVTLIQLERRDEAIPVLWEAGQSAEKLGWWAGVEMALEDCFMASYAQRDFDKMLECKRVLFSVHGRTGAREKAAYALADLGSVHGNLGDFPQSIEYFEPVLDEYKDVLNPSASAHVRIQLALAFHKMGQYAEAQLSVLRALDIVGAKEFIEADAAEAAELAAQANTVLGMLRTELGEFEEGGRLLRGVLAHYEKTEELRGRASALGSLAELAEAQAVVALADGEPESADEYLDEAEEFYDQALELYEEGENEAFAARARIGLASVHLRRGKLKKAVRELKSVLRDQEDLNDREARCSAHGLLSLVYHQQGDMQRALAQRMQNLVLAKEAMSVSLEAESLGRLAALHLERGDLDDALERCREAEGVLSLIFDRLAPGQAARAREQTAEVYEVGLGAAVAQARTRKDEERLTSLAEACFWLEGGRAGVLLTALESRREIRDRGIDAKLTKIEDEARTTEAIAKQRYLDAQESSKRKAIKEARAALEKARRSLKDAIERISLEGNFAAGLLYPKPADLSTIQATLADGDALLLYGSHGTSSKSGASKRETVALVVTKASARLIELGEDAPISAACAALREGIVSEGDTGALATVRKLAIDPLELGADIKRVLFSPGGALSYQAPGMLFPERDVVCVPSGSAYSRLKTVGKPAPGNVLAVADPVYGPAPERFQGCPAERGGKLVQLPGTRKEAEAITDLTLLGENATEAGLRSALEKLTAEGKRLRAVHIACHGLVDDVRPGYSALALTATDEDDGLLTVNEIFQLQIPADLVVLSACESGLGRLMRAEGIQSLSQAFMIAGAPRVMVSLWKVDDEATRELMTKFYELWNPKDPTKGIAAADALRKAQAHVRSQEKWKHPKYWAAWQLWGPAD